MVDALTNLGALRKGVQPLHRQVEGAIRKLMTEPRYARGELFPDELTLAKRLGVSRGTVRAALGRLVSDGRLERKAGIGTRVVPRSAESAVEAWRSFSREMKSRGIDVVLFRVQLQRVRSSEAVATALRVKPGTQLYRLDRVRGWGELPVLHSRSWFHTRVSFNPGETFVRPLYEIIAESSGIVADRASEAFDGALATAALSRELRIKRGTPLLLRRHTVFDPMDRPFEFAEIHYVSARFTLTLDLKRELP